MRGFHVKFTKHVLAAVTELNWSGRQQLERLWVTFFQLLCGVKSVGKLIGATFARYLLDTVKKLYLDKTQNVAKYRVPWMLFPLAFNRKKKMTKFDGRDKVQEINRRRLASRAVEIKKV